MTSGASFLLLKGPSPCQDAVVWLQALTDYPFLLAWGEDVRIEANVKGRAADGAHSLAGVADHLPASRVYCGDV